MWISAFPPPPQASPATGSDGSAPPPTFGIGFGDSAGLASVAGTGFFAGSAPSADGFFTNAGAGFDAGVAAGAGERAGDGVSGFGDELGIG